jgi:hypothetical protein
MTELGGFDLLIAWGIFALLLMAFVAMLLRRPADIYDHLDRPLRGADTHVPDDERALRGAEVSDSRGLLGGDQNDHSPSANERE